MRACGSRDEQGGIPDLVTDGVNGMLVNRGDSEVLAEKLSALSGDTATRTRMGNAAKQTVENRLLPKGETETWLEVYRLLDPTGRKTADAP